MEVANVLVQIVRFVDGHEPGWVACEFKDAEGRGHTFIDKVPIFTREDIRADSTFPKQGVMPCELLDHWRDMNGRELVRISTGKPLDNKSVEGLSEFVVLAADLSS
jgi:hypothetical protein